MDEAAFEWVTARAKRVRQAGPHATSARYLTAGGRLVVGLSTGAELRVPVAIIEGLAGASPEDLREIEVTPAGLGLHFPRLDADVYVPALIEGVTGSGKWMAQHLGRAGGSARTERKAQASRENGKLGGRPRTRQRELVD
ncbi:hypothetical protein M446_7004 (plasmid) [Methylobacterium sp. 4-46]|uniref:DUF2442 domain-containing protein n=1 Tax=unclassified Methylobacterium TaxID=2615210 RepID=UPI000152D858|nr:MULTISPECIES: DUF2442 domain-containing protein [Methylobacterium]ACA21230.1 hypothetical protein M446_7004 [Methylobacterium sp. 4-46]WFT83794.1 DUF2442 domain-containing protein [Methylobacterium nodulans]